MRSDYPHHPIPEPLVDRSALACHPYWWLRHSCQGNSFPYGQDWVISVVFVFFIKPCIFLLLTMNRRTGRFSCDWSYLCAGTIDARHQVERHAYFHPGITLFLVLPEPVCLLLEPCFLPWARMWSAPWMSRNSRLQENTSCKTCKPRDESARWTIHGHLMDLYPWHWCMPAPEVFSIAAQSSETKPWKLEAKILQPSLCENDILELGRTPRTWLSWSLE